MGSIADAVVELRSAQKSNRGAPAYSRFVNRPLGRLLAAVAYTLGLSPNTVTVLSACATFSGIAVIALVRPSLWSSVLITFLLVLGYALDSADGQVSRLLKRSTLDGEWLDHMADAAKMGSIHLAVLISWFRFWDLSDGWLVVPIVFQVTASVFFVGVILTELLRRINRLSKPDEEAAAPTGRTSLVYSLAVIPADYGLLCLVFLTFSFQPVFVTIYTVLAVVNLVVLVLSGFRWFRSIRALRTPA